MTFKDLIVCILVLACCGGAFGQDSYRCVDDRLQLDLIDSDPEAFYISMDMDPRGNLYVGGRDAVYLFEADGEGGFKARGTITTLPQDTWAYSSQVSIDPNLGRFVPFGTCYYNEDHLGDAYRRSLVVARWRSRELGQFPLTPRPASFASTQRPLLVGKGTARPVAVFTGNDGRLFASICFMERNEASPVKQTDLVVNSNPNKPLKPHPIDPSSADIKTLLDAIESPSWKRRFNAHREIISRGMRGDEHVRERFFNATPGSPAWHCLAWLAGRHDDERVIAALTRELSSADAPAASTAADVLRRFHQLSESQVKSLLAGESPVSQLAGLRAANELGPGGGQVTVAELAKSFGNPQKEQPKALAASATTAYAGSPLRDSLNELATSSDSLVRQAAQRWIVGHTTWSQLLQDDGKVLLGFLSGEDQNRVTLQMMDGSLKAIEKSQIEVKAPSKTSRMPVGLISGPEDLKHIVRYLMTLKSLDPSPSSPEALAVSEVPDIPEDPEDLLTVDVFRSINPTVPNTFQFAPTEAKYVPVDVLKSSSGQPCIDEPEVFSGDTLQNLALHSSGAMATASSLLKGHEEKHQIEHLNDGKYGNAHSWIPAKNTGWAQIELPEAMTIERVVLSRDRGGRLTRRVPVAFDILVSMDGKEWQTVKKVRTTPAKKARSRRTAAATHAQANTQTAEPQVGQAERLPNVLWITVEDMSPTLGCYGDSFARTPNLDAFAKESILYTNAFAASPVCSPSRSTLITGMYNASMGTNQMRSSNNLPTGVKGFPSLLREAGYYTSNNVKTDYNCAENKRLIEESWDVSSAEAHWKDRESGQPFFAVFNDMTTHQSRTMVWPFPVFQEHVQSRLSKQEISNPEAVPLPPYYPDTPVVRKTVARFYDCVTVMDKNVQRILDQLEEDGLADDTIVFFYSDHGSGMPRHKRLLLDSGMRVALMVRFPKKYQHLAPAAPGTRLDRLVSFVDFPPTVLNLTGQPIPDYMQGIPFLGPGSETERETVYGTRDRVDEVMETARSVRDKQFLFVRNYMPHLSYNQPSAFSDLGEIRNEITRAARTNLAALTAPQRAYAGPRKPVEEFYDCIADPENVVNLLAGELNPDQQAAFERLRSAYAKTRRGILDVGALPESVMRDHVRQEKAPIRDILQGKTDHAPDLDAAWAAADVVGKKDRDSLVTHLSSLSAADRYWSLVGMRVDFADDSALHELAASHLTDIAADVRIEAASWLAESSKQYLDRALQSLIDDTALEDWWSALRACRAIELLGPKAESLLPRMKELYAKHRNQSGDQSFFIAFSSGAFLDQFGVETIPWDFSPGGGGFSADPDKHKASADAEAGFTSIFDGKSLDQWDHRKGAWKMVDGAISCTGAEKTRNWIIWRGGTPSDFVLRLDFKYEAGNSGVQVRSDDQGDHQVYGYQVEIAAQNKMGLWHHSLLTKEDPAHEARFFMATAGQEVSITTDGEKSVKQVASKEETVAHYRQDGWNSMEIIAEGNTLTQKINGVVFSKVADDDTRMSRRKGVIALQDHGKGCQVAFRNIRIKDLSRDGK